MGNLQSNPNNNQEKQSIWTKETLGVVLILFSTLVLVCLITRGSVFSKPGEWVNTFFFGCFGYFAYLVVGLTVYYGLVCITGKRINLDKKVSLFAWLSVITLAFLLHVITMRSVGGGYGDYISASYLKARAGGMATCSGGGFFVGMVAYIFPAILKNVGSYVVLSILFAVCVFVLVKTIMEKKGINLSANRQVLSSTYVPSSQNTVVPNAGVTLEGEKDYPVDFAIPEQQGTQKLFVASARKDDFRAPKTKGEQPSGLRVDYTPGGLSVASSSKPYSQTYTDDMQSKIDYIKTPSPINIEKTSYVKPSETARVSEYEKQQQANTSVSDYVNRQTPVQPTSVEEEKPVDNIPLFEHETPAVDDAESHARRFSRLADLDGELDTPVNEPTEVIRPLPKEEMESSQPTEESFEESVDIEVVDEQFDMPIIEPIVEEQPPVSSITRERARSVFSEADSQEEQPQEEQPDQFEEEQEEEPPTNYTSRVRADGNIFSRGVASRVQSVAQPQPEPEPEKPPKPAPPINREYFRPPIDLLQKYEKSNIDSSEEHKTNMEIIKQTLSEFNIEAEPQSYVQGPTITRYEVMMPTGVSARKVLGCVDQLQMRLASASGVRVQAPIPGKNLVGIEVANAHPEKVGLREVLELAAAKGPSKPNSLMFALGKDIVGNPICDNLAKGPHYLVAGSTGAGKSVCLNAMIISLIMRYSPEELRLFLVDPKTVEFSAYKHLPHLMIDEIITSARKAKEMLKWAHVEMERRFKVLYDCDAIACRDIDDYNSRIASDTVAKMPRIVIIIDELADLMMQENKKELEGEICSIAQKARAVGIHLVVATQRPSVDVVTGLIKTNLPSRIAFKTTSHTDSQTILDRGGAEQLLGNGDMLYKNAQMPYTERYQGAFIDNFEVNNVVQYIIKNNQAYFDDELQEYLEKVSNPEPEPAPEEVRVVDENPENDATFLTALWFAITKTTVSISSLQRRFSFGFSRAGRIIDLMDRMGYLAPSEGGNKPRKVLLSAEEYLQKYGEAPTGDGRL